MPSEKSPFNKKAVTETSFAPSNTECEDGVVWVRDDAFDMPYVREATVYGKTKRGKPPTAHLNDCLLVGYTTLDAEAPWEVKDLKLISRRIFYLRSYDAHFTNEVYNEEIKPCESLFPKTIDDFFNPKNAFNYLKFKNKGEYLEDKKKQPLYVGSLVKVERKEGIIAGSLGPNLSIGEVVDMDSDKGLAGVFFQKEFDNGCKLGCLLSRRSGYFLSPEHLIRINETSGPSFFEKEAEPLKGFSLLHWDCLGSEFGNYWCKLAEEFGLRHGWNTDIKDGQVVLKMDSRVGVFLLSINFELVSGEIWLENWPAKKVITPDIETVDMVFHEASNIMNKSCVYNKSLLL